MADPDPRPRPEARDSRSVHVLSMKVVFVVIVFQGYFHLSSLLLLLLVVMPVVVGVEVGHTAGACAARGVRSAGSSDGEEWVFFDGVVQHSMYSAAAAVAGAVCVCVSFTCHLQRGTRRPDSVRVCMYRQRL